MSQRYGVYTVLKQVDKLHLKFCKSILGVRIQTPNFAVYGELGRYPLYTIAKGRAIKYWMTVKSNNESLISRIYNEQSLIANRSNSFWVNKVKQTLKYTDLIYLSDKNDLNNTDFKLVQSRLRDHFKQEWSSFINNSSTTVSLKNVSS